MLQELVRAVRPDTLSSVGHVTMTRPALLVGAIVMLINLAFTGAVVEMAGVYPLPWVDEVSYADPFFNAAEGRGLTSGAWDSQPYGQLWASNSPLYGLIALPGLKVFGATVEVWRGFWSLAFGVALVGILWSAWGLGIVRSAWALLLAGVVLQTAYTMTFLPICGRGVDVGCLIVLAFGMVSLAFLRGRWKVSGLFFSGLLAPVAGFQLVPAMACALICFLVVDWRKAFCAGVWLASGIFTGLLLMVSVFAVMGVATVFLGKTVGSAGFSSVGAVAHAVVLDSAEQLLRENRYNVVFAFSKMFSWDPATLAAGLGVILCIAASVLSRSKTITDPLGKTLGFLGLLGVPVALILAGRLQTYYYWMGFVPVVLCLALYASPPMSRVVRAVAFLSLATVLAVAAGNSWFFRAASEYQSNRKIVQMVELLVQEHVGAADIAFVDELAYFPARIAAAEVRTDQYSGSKLFPRVPEQEEQTFTVAIVLESETEKVMGPKLRGKWVEVDSLVVDENPNNQWRVYRRQSQ
jgi:hypothetical protein